MISLNICRIDGLLRDLVRSNDFGSESWLIDDKSGLELLDAGLAGLKALLDGHVLPVVLVEHRVDEVARIAVSALSHLLKSAKIVHPVKLRLLLNLIIATH